MSGWIFYSLFHFLHFWWKFFGPFKLHLLCSFLKPSAFLMALSPFSAVSPVNLIRSASLISMWSLHQLSFPLTISSPFVLFFLRNGSPGDLLSPMMSLHLPLSLFHVSLTPFCNWIFILLFQCLCISPSRCWTWSTPTASMTCTFFPLRTHAKCELFSWFFSDSRKLCFFCWHCSSVRVAEAHVQ